jgi:histidine triad (HIT) family protein
MRKNQSSSRAVTLSLSLSLSLVRELEHLTRGLLFMSESDDPIQVVIWQRPGGSPTVTRVAALTGEAHPDLAHTMTVDEFFRAATTPRPGDDAEERALVRRFAGLVHFLKTRLAGVRVFRFGRLSMRSYIVGTTPSGDWLGLATAQVET